MRSDTVVAWLVGDRGRMRDVRFSEGGIEFSAQVNEDSLWGAVKDNLVLAEYERCGIALADQRGVVVDAGAHVGLFSLLASAHARRVIALEPHPDNFRLLSENIARNRRANVDARQCALWCRTGTVGLAQGQDSGSATIHVRAATTLVVRSETLDAIVTEPVDFLKLDIEGAEYDVLAHASDATLRRVSAIAAELHGLTPGDRDARLARLLARLADAGFDVVVRRPPVAYWGEAIGAVLRSRRRLRGALRLRLAVAATYTATAMTDPFLHLRSRLEFGLAFLFARRSSTSHDGTSP